MRVDLNGLHDADALRPPDPPARARRSSAETWIRRLCDGSAVGAIALTEPGAGSDVAAMRTIARRDGDDYVINGEKTFISNGDRADVIVLFASVDLAAARTASPRSCSRPGTLTGLEVGPPDEEAGPEGRLHRHSCFPGLPHPRVGADGGGGRGLPAAAAVGRPFADQRRRAGARVRAGRVRRRRGVGRRA